MCSSITFTIESIKIIEIIKLSKAINQQMKLIRTQILSLIIIFAHMMALESFMTLNYRIMRVAGKKLHSQEVK